MADRKKNAASRGGESVSKKRSLKQQIRDIQRLLSKDDLPETVRLTKERVLKSLQDEVNDKTSQRQKQKMAKKYRMVKFFDKRKVIRKLTRACREYSTVDPSQRSELLDEVHQLRKELNYIVHFPPQEKYIALYPSSTPSSQSALTKQGQLLQSIAVSVETGELPDATQEELTLPDTLIDSDQLVHSVGDSGHQRSSDKRNGKKRLATDEEGEDMAAGKKELRQDGFFLIDSDS